jgi:hypothetical protein
MEVYSSSRSLLRRDVVQSIAPKKLCIDRHPTGELSFSLLFSSFIAAPDANVHLGKSNLADNEVHF